MSLRMAALGMLAQQPGSGYDLLKRFEMSMANVWPATQSQLYAELKRLADHDLIEVAEIGPRGRKLYRVTTAGRSELLRWIASPQDDPPYRSPELLRIFLLGELPRAEAAEHVRGLADHAESELARLTALRDSPDCADMPGTDFYGFAALQYGLRFQAMQAEWARWLESAIVESDVASR
ncbi:PadR family transcriptional regulator [Mycolicibacterium neoaurum]|uniref:PadR family transcriptional regulator n=1 Tax=Mycolicibacterium neoaurum TaxID=1795 RepID=UPI00248D1CDE|nr:PadR family transcriptional regulator [Mycolicibacterium neoaurum]MDO3399761.1 PadR family transcriptional regulator [Mycolicibacterium neoaurum]WBP93490.1 PadR family transcriptional regulator [Mycolicibacterium neoaurum]WBS07284.1 PadR family transcriptional regulator [Mycolicibacterium neoaurum]